MGTKIGGVRFTGPMVMPAQGSKPDPTSTSAVDAARLRYVPGLDGLRAVAVIAVLLYHAGLRVPGGFLGVEVFFVLSGFLITALLLTEWHERGRISLVGFWFRRARRLLPALLFMLVGTLLFAALRLPNDVAEIGADARAALLYVMNWHLIRSGQSYFDPLLRPPLLQHLWSLAVEEQFYLLWPLLFIAGMRVARPIGLLIVTLLGAAASMTLMAALYLPGADPSRVYYGTDTRAAGVLLGAALAFIWRPDDRRAGAGHRNGRLVDSAGVLALCALIVCFLTLPAHHPLLYRGSFALVDVMTVSVIAAITHPSAWLTPRLLEWTPLRVIGLRSYGLYLWHWPIFMVTRPGIDLPLDGLPLLALRLVILGVVVEASYRYVELPVRHGALSSGGSRFVTLGGACLRSLAPRPGAEIRRRLLLFLTMCLVLVLVASVSIDDVSRASVPDGTSSSENFASLIQGPAPTASRTAVRAAAIQPRPFPTAGPRSDAPGTPVPASIPARPSSPALESTRLPATRAPTSPLLDPILVVELQRVLASTVSGGYVPGAVLSVGIPGYEPWSGASGLADRGRNLAMEPDTLVHLASITKLFTAVVVLQLAEEHTIDLEVPIDTYLPGLVRSGQSTTVRQLLSHTTGIYDYQEDTRFFAEGYENPESHFTPSELVARADQEALAFRPGTAGAWKYSSTNYVILGMLVEQVTGQSLAQEMRERIFTPLELKQTFFAPQEAVEGAVAQGYIGSSDRVELSMSFVFATGNLISTVDDLRRFAEGLFGGRLLRNEALAAMTTLMDTNGAFRMPELRYGLGVMGAQMSVGPGTDGKKRPSDVRAVLGHIGGIGGFRSAVWWAPESGITIALSLNQADIDPNVLARDVFDAVLTWQGR